MTQRPPLGLFRTLARFGVVDLTIDVLGADAPGVPPTIEDMTPDVRAAYLAIGFQPAYVQALIDGGATIEESDT